MTVADKYQDVLTLEASVAELHQMFLDFALLTEKQGELLDQIEHQVSSIFLFLRTIVVVSHSHTHLLGERRVGVH